VFKCGMVMAPKCPNNVQVRIPEVPMVQEPHLALGPFRLEPMPGRLWRSPEDIALRPRALAVLWYAGGV
jgi:hypothetical protein